MIMTKTDIFDDIDEIIFQSKTFVLTGTFTIGSRAKVKELIVERGGIVKKAVTNSIDYLIVGEVASDGWKHGNYGNKINNAIETKKRYDFLDLKIVHEQDFIKLFDKPQANQDNDSLKTIQECFEKINIVKKYPNGKIDIDIDSNGNLFRVEANKNIDYPLKEIFKILNNTQILHYKLYIGHIKHLFLMLSKKEQEQYKLEILDKIHKLVLRAINNIVSELIISANQLKTKKGKINRLKRNYENLLDDNCFATSEVRKIVYKIADEIKKIKNEN